MIRRFALLSLMVIVNLGSVARADDPATSERSGWGRSPEQGSGIITREFVQPQYASSAIAPAACVYQEQQRLARLEANAWMGYEPLRPSWPSSPSMTSRYQTNRVVVIPYFVP